VRRVLHKARHPRGKGGSGAQDALCGELFRLAGPGKKGETLLDTCSGTWLTHLTWDKVGEGGGLYVVVKGGGWGMGGEVTHLLDLGQGGWGCEEGLREMEVRGESGVGGCIATAQLWRETLLDTCSGTWLTHLTLDKVGGGRGGGG
jgi:hypothetical protein